MSLSKEAYQWNIDTPTNESKSAVEIFAKDANTVFFTRLDLRFQTW